MSNKNKLNYLIIGSLKETEAYFLSLFKEKVEEIKVLVVDNIGKFSKIINENVVDVKEKKITFHNTFNDKITLTKLISLILNLNSHERRHLFESLKNLKKFSIENVIDNLYTTLSPFVHSLNDILIIEEMITKLEEIMELDEVLDEQINFLSILEENQEKDFIIFNISKVNSTKVKRLITFFILNELIYYENPFPEMLVMINNPEGLSLLNIDTYYLEFLLEILDKLTLNDITYCFLSTFEELNKIIITRFNNIIIFNYNSYQKIIKTMDKNISVNFINGNALPIKEIELPYYNFETVSVEHRNMIMYEKKTKDLLEIEYKDFADLIADFILEIEKSLITRKEALNILFSLGFFGKDAEAMIDKLIKDQILEEKIIGGVKKLMPSQKGLFLAKKHKLNNARK